jgi:hypothetical protein
VKALATVVGSARRLPWQAVAVVGVAVALLSPGAARAATTGEISGGVTSGVTGIALAGAYVDVYSSSGVYAGATTSDHNGNFTISDLAAGTYQVEFSDAGYLTQYYDDEPTEASPVTVSAGANTTGVNATLEVAGAISGRVTDALTDGPAIDTEVQAFNSNGEELESTITDQGGGYTIPGLSTGSYDVEFVPQGTQPYQSQYYSGASSLSSATSVAVTDGQTHSGIDAALSSGAAISGTVTDASSGKPVSDAYAEILDSSGDYVSGAFTNSNGVYEVGGLAAGDYKVEFGSGEGENYLTQFYNDAASEATADTVELSDGENATANAKLSAGGEITGTVTDAKTKSGLADVYVYAYSSTSGVERTAVTNANGDYTIESLPSAGYTVEFHPNDGSRAPQFYDEAASQSTAKAVPVTAGSATAGISAALSTGGTITGTVTDEASGTGTTGVAVVAFAPNGSEDAYTTTASDGTYSLGGLAAGSYDVEFEPQYSSAYATQYYDAASSSSGATPVSVSLGQTTTGIDAAMVGGGSISGTVDSGSAANPLGGVQVYLSSSSDNYYEPVTTMADGSFFIAGVPAGTYTVEFAEAGGAYQYQYYNGQVDSGEATPIAVASGKTTTGIDATFQAEGEISGTVTDAGTNAGIGGIDVEAYPTAGGTIETAQTASNGSYTIPALPAGTYKLLFDGANYQTAYYDNQTSYSGANPVTVTAGQTTDGIDQALDELGTVSGTVTDVGSGAGVSGASVTVYTTYGSYIASAVSGAGGAYSVVGIPSGTYAIGFSSGATGGSYATTYYKGSQTLSSATPISVTDGRVTSGIDQALPDGGIAGTVTDAVLGSGLANIDVDIYNGNGQVVGSAKTGSAGDYSIDGLAPGSYSASFSPVSQPSAYVEQYYKDETTPASADTILVTAEHTTSGVDAAMARGGIVSGTVTAATGGADLGGIDVDVYSTEGGVVGSTTTATNGTYAVGGLIAGTYSVGFAPPGGGTMNYLSQYYDNEASLSRATSIYVTPGTTKTGINAALQSAGQVTGVVTDAKTQAPIQNAYVDIYRPVYSYYGTYDEMYGTALTNAKGIYTVSGLPTGSYDVSFSVLDGDYLEQWYDAENASASATSVSVTQGSETSGIDAQLDPPAQIQGTVTDASNGKPLSGVKVAVESSSGQLLEEASTGTDGTYDAQNLYPGSYTVELDPPSGENYLTQYYNGASSTSNATAVTVSVGANVTGIDAALQAGGQISGTVTSEVSAAALSNVGVYIYDSSGSYVEVAYTDSSGDYTASALPTGSYVVEFYGVSPYYTQYYNGQSSYGSANPVSVTAGKDTVEIDAAMSSGGQVTGTVTSSATSQPIANAAVIAEYPNGGYAGEAQTNSSGVYTIGGLATGDYTIQFSATGYGPQTYSGSVSATVNETTSGIDAALAPDGSIQGTVTDASTSSGVANVYVDAYNPSGDYESEAETGSSGSYTLSDLPAGSYELEFSPTDNQDYLPQYYDEKTSLATATQVTVTSAHATTAIDAALQAAGHITGTVTNSVTGAAVGGVEVTVDNAGTDAVVTEAETSSNGAYSVGGLSTGDYIISFYDYGYVGQYYDEQTSQGAADPVAVTVGKTSSAIDAAMAPDGGISGTVTDAATKDPLAETYVYVIDSSGDEVAEQYTDTNGNYSVTDLPPGAYSVEFADYNSSAGYIQQYYNGEYTLATADPVTVAPGRTTTGIDVGMTQYGAISGTVTDGSDNEAIPNVEVEVYDSSGDIVGSSYTSSTGEYTVGALAPGVYHVSFSGETSNGQSVTQYYNQESSLATADAVTVASAQTTSDIDVSLISLPENSAVPTITGTAAQGETLTEVNGTWSPTPTSYGYQWERCDPSDNCTLISGATQQTYVPTNLDVGDTLLVEETATNLAGTTQPIASTQTQVVIAEAPVNTLAPGISGNPEQGQTLAEIPGSWTNQPTGGTYQWERCASAKACSDIANATGQTYTPTAADVGDTIEVQETATNDAGPGTPAVSAATRAVTGPGPVNTTAPAISGTDQAGQTLTENEGTWSGDATSYSYQWERCDSAGANCHAIEGATGQGYTLTARDVGDTIGVVETASNANGPGQPAPSGPTGVIAQAILTASAGESMAATEGVPVTFDGSGSAPASVITGYRWDFGDGKTGVGAGVQHTYSAAGHYTATLAVTDGTSTAKGTVTVTVSSPAPGAAITVRDSKGGPISGADVVYMASDGSRISATSDGDGIATLEGLPDGSDGIYAYASGYQVATGSVTVSGGVGSATMNLDEGQVATASLTSTPMTLAQIEAAGIDPNAPGNQSVYQFHIELAFPPDYAGTVPDLCGFVNGSGEFVGDTGSCGGGGGGGGGTISAGHCTANECYFGNVEAVPEIVHGEPLIQWLVLNGHVTVLKQFFSVDMLIDNLSPASVDLDNGTATLNLPDGLSLAPTATPQSDTQSVASIPGNGSADVNWIVRGDDPGLYYLSADYDGTLDPFGAPVHLQATLQEPLHVWGANGLSLSVEADSGALVVGQPYHVRLAITNVADVPFYNVGLAVDSAPPARTIWQPDQGFSSQIGELAPGQTLYSPGYILVPDAASAGDLDPSESFASFAGRQLDASSTIQPTTPPTLYSLTSKGDVVGDVHLHWESVPGASSYEVFSIPNLDTPFQSSPDNVLDENGNPAIELPASATDAYEPEPAGSDNYFAVSAIVDGVPTLAMPVISATPGVAQPPSTTGSGGGGAGAPGTTGAGGPGAPAPTPGCIKPTLQLTGGIDLQASCFHEHAGVWTASGEVWANGFAIKSSGTFSVDPAALSISASGSVQVYAGSLEIYHDEGGINWSFDHSETFTVPSGLKVGGLGVSGSATVGFKSGAAYADVKASVSAAAFTASGEIDLQLTFAHGLQLNGWELSLDSDIPLGSLVVKQASLKYATSGNTWTGAVDVDVPELSELEGALTISNGKLSEVSIKLPHLNKPLGEIVFLQELGIDVTLHPQVSIAGTVGLTAGPEVFGHSAASLNGSLSLTFGDPFVLSASGNLSVVSVPIGGAWLKVTIPGGVGFGGWFDRSIAGVGVEGQISGNVEAKRFELKGSITASAGPLSASGYGVVNQVGLAACAVAHTFFGNAQVGGAYRWDGSSAWLQDACGFSGLEALLSASDAAAGPIEKEISVPAGMHQINVITRGSGAPPEVLLIHGASRAVVTPDSTGKFAGGGYVAIGDTVHDETDIAIVKPPRGELGVGAAPGEPGLASIGTTTLLPNPIVKTKLSSLGNGAYRLTWSAKNVAGQSLLFVDRDANDQAQIVSTQRTHGSVRFTAQDPGQAALHRVVVLILQQGLIREEMPGPSFRTHSLHLPPPQVTQHSAHGTTTVKWSAVRGAAAYRVFITAPGGLSLFFERGAHITSVTVPAAGPVRAKVQAVSAYWVAGSFGASATEHPLSSRKRHR